MARRRLLGVYGANLPTKKSKGVVSSDFLIGGLIGHFERKFDEAILVKSPQEVQTAFGLQIDSSQYGWDAVSGFFANVSGIDAKLYIVSHVGYTGSAIDAVQASQSVPDGTPQNVFTVSDAYKGINGYGTSGNRTGITITNTPRVTTQIAQTSLASDTFVYVANPAGVKIGDIIKVVATGGGGATVYKKVTGVDEGTKKVSFSGAFHGSATPALNDVVTVLGFRLQVWRKLTSGLVQEVEPELGKIVCTTESEVSEFFAPNVFAQSSWIKVVRNATTPATPDKTLPADIATPAYPTNGANGTSPTTAAHWSRTLTRFDNLPVRFITNCESTVELIQKAIETYAQGRWDNPKVLWNWPSNQTKAQLALLAGAFQRSDAVLGAGWAQWLYVSDPFNTSPNAPYRAVPNVGHIMGLCLRTIGQRGIHYAPAMKDSPIFGAAGVYGDQFLLDTDRTDLSDYGVNCIQNLSGYGIVSRNAFTSSVTIEFSFLNGLMLRDYIKVSAVDSLQASENTPNSFGRIKEDKMAILSFLYRLWEVGSTGSVPPGETFGQMVNDDGTFTTAEQHFEVRADLVNNPKASVQAGERNLDVYFTYPAPAGSIRIGVGIMLLS